MPQLIENINEMQDLAGRERQDAKTIGVVPTMGFLHEGHLKLIREARRLSDTVITTVFVNPAQFGPAEDFDRYPRNLPRDIDLAGSAGTDIVFAPDAASIYPPGYCTYVDVTQLDSVLEGKSRPGHFRGVATVVTKLFNITKPHLAVFGQKDAQQVVVIKTLVRDLNLDVELVIVPTVREKDGLAMSSRNAYLTAEQRREASALYRSLQHADRRIREGERQATRIIGEMTDIISGQSSGVIDYISVADGATLEELPALNGHSEILVSLAVRFGNTRLIDNIHVSL